jgi:hypothetical protein
MRNKADKQLDEAKYQEFLRKMDETIASCEETVRVIFEKGDPENNPDHADFLQRTRANLKEATQLRKTMVLITAERERKFG